MDALAPLRDDLLTPTIGVFPRTTGPRFSSDEVATPAIAYARIEYRGGVEAYMEAASGHLARDGVFVMCGDARADARVVTFAPTAGLALTSRIEFIPRAGKSPLFSVWTFAKERASSEPHN